MAARRSARTGRAAAAARSGAPLTKARLPRATTLRAAGALITRQAAVQDAILWWE